MSVPSNPHSHPSSASHSTAYLTRQSSRTDRFLRTNHSPPSSSQTQFANHTEKDAFVPGNEGRKKGLSKWIKYGVPLLVLVIIGAVVGGVVGSRASKNNLSASGSSAAGTNASSSSSSSSTSKATNAGGVAGGAGATSASSAATAASTAGTVVVKNLAAWNWGKDKAIGMCLGNWLILERSVLFFFPSGIRSRYSRELTLFEHSTDGCTKIGLRGYVEKIVGMNGISREATPQKGKHRG